MLMKIRRAAAAVALIAFGALAAAPASAATFNFTGDFFGSIAPDSPSKTFTVDGITVTVTAGTFSNASNPSNINFANRLVDLDFFSGLGADGRFDGDNIDGRLGNDVLVFSFSRKITGLKHNYRNYVFINYRIYVFIDNYSVSEKVSNKFLRYNHAVCK